MSEVLEDNLEEIYRFAIDLGKSAGKILLEGIERRRVTADDGAQEAIEKLNSVDIVTQTDNGMHLGS
jgi:myo-inositol-1(or 4)-monophosphatase